jgi:hypothetical protein
MSLYVHKQNCRYWAPDKQHELHQRTLLSPKVTVRCAISCHGITGPYFFENTESLAVTATAECYKFVLEIFLRNLLRPRHLDLFWFKRDGVTARTAQISM